MKVKAIFRRIDAENDPNTDNADNHKFVDISILPKIKSAQCDGVDLGLTPNEYALLTYLILNQDRAVSRTELLDKIWGYETEVETRVADDTVKRLRKKLSKSRVIIKTVWGFGFRLKSSADNDDLDESEASSVS